MDEAARHYQVIDRFFADAKDMRRELDASIGDRGDPFDARRFVWEHWHVPAQFSQQRAPARRVFSPAIMERFERRLLDWAGRNLGLVELGGPPWVSCLVDGQYQSLHRDSPNGLFAYSFGLSKPDRPRFRGGETLLARPELLDYWRTGGAREETADTPMFDEVGPRFNRLVVFDARVPHAVRMIEGPRLPREGRVAIQGWLRARGCVLVSDEDADATRLEATNGAVTRALPRRGAPALRDVAGLFTTRVEVARSGKVRDARVLVDVLVPTGPRGDRARAAKILRDAIMRAKFPARACTLVVPLQIAAGAAELAGAATRRR